MNELDYKILADLTANGRLTYAELGRKYNLSRVSIRERINNLIEKGIIEKFTIIVNPEKIGKKISAFFEIEVKPESLYQVAEELSMEEDVVNIYLMTGSATLHMHALLVNQDAFEIFLRDKLYSRKEIVRVNSNIILKRFKSRKGGLRP
jgi:Lrp/AsnC family transcriptional regulator, leucine-responsive regulatory protein